MAVFKETAEFYVKTLQQKKAIIYKNHKLFYPNEGIKSLSKWVNILATIAGYLIVTVKICLLTHFLYIYWDKLKN